MITTSNILTIRQAVARACAEGYSISEYALRQWVRNKEIPVRQVGNRKLIYYPDLVFYLTGQKPRSA